MLKLLNWFRLDPSELMVPSVILLIIANLVPLYGVFFLNWQIFPILLLFWIENVMVGLFNALKMICASPSAVSSWIAKLFIVPFFCFHYGMFTLAHGVFVFGFFGGYFEEIEGFPTASTLFQGINDFRLDWAVLALFVSHLLSFAVNYIGKGEYKKAELKELMFQPYSRVVILHVTIIIGAFLVMLSNAPAIVLVVLILLKIFIDVKTHIREHKKYAARGQNRGEEIDVSSSNA